MWPRWTKLCCCWGLLLSYYVYVAFHEVNWDTDWYFRQRDVSKMVLVVEIKRLRPIIWDHLQDSIWNLLSIKTRNFRDNFCLLITIFCEIFCSLSGVSYIYVFCPYWHSSAVFTFHLLSCKKCVRSVHRMSLVVRMLFIGRSYSQLYGITVIIDSYNTSEILL